MKKIATFAVGLVAIATLALPASASERCQHVPAPFEPCVYQQQLVRAEIGDLVQVTVTNDGLPALLVINETRGAIGIGNASHPTTTLFAQSVGTGTFVFTVDPTDWRKASIVGVKLYECATYSGTPDYLPATLTVAIV